MTENIMGIPSIYGLEKHGIRNLNMAYWNLTTGSLVERIVTRREGVLAHEGAVIVRTGSHTGRAPNDKFIVHDQTTEESIWWGEINQSMNPACFERLFDHMRSYFQGRDVFIQDTTACAHPDYRLPIRIVTETAWHNLFTRNLFIRVDPNELKNHIPHFTVLHAPGFHANPDEDGTNSEVFVVLNLERKLILIGGTSYAGEIKKSIFTTLNFLMPMKGVLPMHCSANIGKNGDVALFFGLSGTGKTTLSSDAERLLIGDDEHGWADEGIFNFEGGCYAKTIHLDPELEPLIWKATRHFGTVLENVTIDSYSRRVNFNEMSLTENTRAAYPIGFLDSMVPDGLGGHPSNIFFLCADAFGVMPPISRLSINQAIYYFLSGYTSKLAGTEKGITEPKATFSTCFGAPFLPLHPTRYAHLLKELIQKHGSRVWLINTGWTGGPYGIGTRIHLPYTRRMINAVLNGELEQTDMRKDENFCGDIPELIQGIPRTILFPRESWADKNSYNDEVQNLIEKFQANFTKYQNQVSPEVVSAGPTRECEKVRNNFQ